MRLSEIMDRCGCSYRLGSVDPEITMISSDSRTINEGGLFIAIEGFKDSAPFTFTDYCEGDVIYEYYCTAAAGVVYDQTWQFCTTFGEAYTCSNGKCTNITG